MDFYIINGSPRKKYNTAELLENAGQGIKDELKDTTDVNIHQIHLWLILRLSYPHLYIIIINLLKIYK